MAIQLTPEEQQLFKEGKLDINNLIEHRKVHPVRTINVNEVDTIKNEIRQVNLEYKEAIQKNKDLYDALVENRKRKEELRNKLADLRKKKKELLGLE